MIKAIIIDDESHCRETLSILLANYCPDVSTIEKCSSAKNGLEAIEKHKPELVFLDIEMPVMNGFEILEQYKEIPFSVIFTTSYDHYAIKAIRFSALDYLLKPIDPKELMIAVQKATRLNKPAVSQQVKMLIDQLHHQGNGITKIAVPTSEGFEMICLNEVISCEADDNYTRFFLKNKQKIVICRTLKETEEQLEPFSFFMRVHNSYIVNLNEVNKFIRSEGGYLIMSDGSTINVSRSRKESLLKKMLPG